MFDLGRYHKFISDTLGGGTAKGKTWIYNGSMAKMGKYLYYVCRLRLPPSYQSSVVYQIIDESTMTLTSPPRILPIEPVVSQQEPVDYGPQDARIFEYNGALWIVFNMLCVDGFRRMHLYCLCGGDCRVIVLRINGKDIQHVEKNWTPFVRDDGKLMFIYSFSPLVLLLCVDHATGHCIVTYVGENDRNTITLRGGSPALATDDSTTFIGWLHTTVPAPFATYDATRLPIPARNSTPNEYRSRRYVLKMKNEAKPTLEIGEEITFFGRQVEQVYGYIRGAASGGAKLLVNVDDSISVLIDEPS